MSRGITNNNPFNIIKSGTHWYGAVEPGTDAKFVQFESPVLGLRAGFMVIKNQLHAGYNTIAKIITRFAPPIENPTSNYIAFVSKHADIDQDALLQISDLKAVGIAIVLFENGVMVYDDDTVNKALVAAGIPINGQNPPSESN